MVVTMEENKRIWPGSAVEGEIEILEEVLVWSNPVARLFNDRVRFPNGEGGEPEEGEQFRLGEAEELDDGVVVVPITHDDRILLIRQFRHPIRMWMRELPRGARNRGESPANTASRELREEIGYEVEATYSLGRIANDSGQLTGFPFLVAARVRDVGESEPESTEAIDQTLSYAFSELKRACQRGEIIDSFTLCAVVRLEPHFRGDRFTYSPEDAPPAYQG
jgi:ADP-ribose pyrophosphatase